ELEQPVTESLAGLHLPGTELTRPRIPGQHRLRPRTAGRRAHAQDVLDGVVVALLAVAAVERARQLPPASEHVAGQPRQRIDLDRTRTIASARQQRAELERAHAARADVAQPL